MSERKESGTPIQATEQKAKENSKNPLLSWLQQHYPLSDSSKPDDDYQFYVPDDEKYLEKYNELRSRWDDETFDKAQHKLDADLKDLRDELMPLFQELDLRATVAQNRYKFFQISFLVLAAATTAVGSLQLLVVDDPGNSLISVFGLTETFLSLVTIFLVNIQGNDSPFTKWLTARQRAEQLRREYFRYVTDSIPYSKIPSIPVRRRLMAMRATAINEGKDPDHIEPQGGN